MQHNSVGQAICGPRILPASQPHFFQEIRKPWTEVGKATGRRETTEDPFKSRKGFDYRVRQARASPSNTSIRDLLSNSRYADAVLEYLEATKVGEVKAGVICI